jgi:hypothetical protein
MTQSRPVHSTTTPHRPEDADLYEGPRATSDGIPIIEVQRGQAPAPNPHSQHKLVDFKFLQMILLGDREGTVRYRCAQFKNGQIGERCWRDDFDNPRSAVSHINSHLYTQSPQYPMDTLRLLTRLMRTFKAAKRRDYAILTAEELNRTSVPTLNGEPWNAMQVSNLFNTHGSKFRTPLRKDEVARLTGAELVDKTRPAAPAPTPPTPTRQEPTVPTPTPVNPTSTPTLADLEKLRDQLIKDTDKLFDLVKEHVTQVVDFVEVVGKKLADDASKPAMDPTTVEKAKKWDRYLELRQLIDG